MSSSIINKLDWDYIVLKAGSAASYIFHWFVQASSECAFATRLWDRCIKKNKKNIILQIFSYSGYFEAIRKQNPYLTFSFLMHFPKKFDEICTELPNLYLNGCQV